MDEQNSISPPPDRPSFWQKLLFWKNFASALPLLLLAAAYMVPYSRLVEILELGHGRLGRLMEIEFLVIHSFPFLVIIGLLQPETKKLQIIRTIGFWGLLAIYIIPYPSYYHARGRPPPERTGRRLRRELGKG